MLWKWCFRRSVGVSDPAGDRVFVTVYIADEVVGETEVDTSNDGSPVEVTVQVDPKRRC